MPATTPTEAPQNADRTIDPTVGTGATLHHGCHDDGYADSDDTSRWIERMEANYA